MNNYHVLQMRLNENVVVGLDLPRNTKYFAKIEFLGIERVKVKDSHTVSDNMND